MYDAHAIHLIKQICRQCRKHMTESSRPVLVYPRWVERVDWSQHTQRLDSVVKVQIMIILRRGMSDDSLASTFYWTLYKHGDMDEKTLMGWSHTIMKQYPWLTVTKAIFNDISNLKTTKLSYIINILMDKMLLLTLSVPCFNDYPW